MMDTEPDLGDLRLFTQLLWDKAKSDGSQCITFWVNDNAPDFEGIEMDCEYQGGARAFASFILGYYRNGSKK
jgi:hypothetical protein